MATVKSSSKSSSKSSKKDGKIKMKSVDNYDPYPGLEIKCDFASTLESKGSASVPFIFKKDGHACDHFAITGYFMNRFSPAAAKEMTIKGKKTVFADEKRTYMRQQLTNDDASKDLIRKLNYYDSQVNNCKEIMLSAKLAEHYHQNQTKF
jgi:hypothetical protein